MGAVTVFQKADRKLALDPNQRGHHVVYRANESNRCPGCGRSHWYVGRVTAECGFCGTAIAMAEAQWIGQSGASGALVREPLLEPDDKRRDERLSACGRTLQLLIDGSPGSFALENISGGGLMGSDFRDLAPGTTVHVRFEGGILIPAVVKWRSGDLTGLAFEQPVLLDP